MYPLSKGQKICRICEVVQSVSDFAKHPTTYDRLNPTCKTCRSTIAREKRRIDPEKYRKLSRLNVGQRLLYGAKSRAKKRDLAFDLTIDWIDQRIHICELSGLLMIPLIGSSNGRTGPLSPSIDRRSSKGGYTKDNCRIICFGLNAAFQDWGEDAFEPIARHWIKGLANAKKTVDDQPSEV